MRNYSNQQGGRPSNGNTSGNTSRPSGNRGGYKGQGGGGYNRDREGRDHREHRSGGGSYGNRSGNRYEREERPRSEHRYGAQRPGGHSGGNRYERHEPRHEREERPRHERPEGMQGPRGSSWVEVTGRSVEEAQEEACRRFNVNSADLKTETLEEGSKGFLGIGSKPAKIKISLKPLAVPAFAEGVLSRLLRGMSLPDKVKLQKDEDGNSVLNIQGPSSGTLIGRHGHTLEALQYLVSKVVQRVTGDEKSIVIVDVESYLERQKEKLKELALNLAQKAKETGVEIPMRPMSSKDRRVVHLALKDHEHVTTESRGEGLRRKVVIVPKVKAEVVVAAKPTEEVASSVEPGNAAPVETKEEVSDSQPVHVAETVSHSSEGSEPGNIAPQEPEIDDNIGNKV
jgi:spoIIIJ-associated protein